MIYYVIIRGVKVKKHQRFVPFLDTNKDFTELDKSILTARRWLRKYLMKKLVTVVVLLLLVSASTSWAIFEPEDPFWLEKTEFEGHLIPDEITINSDNEGGVQEVLLDRWFLEEDNLRWFKMVLRRYREFQHTFEVEVQGLMRDSGAIEINGQNRLSNYHPQYRKYHFRDINYFFYYNGNKRFVTREGQTLEEKLNNTTSYFFNNLEGRVQIWGRNARIVITGIKGYIIIPNGKVYDFTPNQGFESLENHGDIWDIHFLPKEAWDLVQDAKTYIGTNHALTVDGKTYNNDCSGFVSALYMKYDIDLIEGIENVKTRSGYNLTSIIFDAQDYNQNLITIKEPMPGDLIFFSNTYDRNGNGVWDDFLSHIGIVEAVDEKGTITFIHHLNAEVGVRRDKMNLHHPDDPHLNSMLRAKRQGDPVHFKYLTGQLWESFARVFH